MPVADNETICIPPAARGNLSEKTFQVQIAVSGHSFFIFQLADGWACDVQFFFFFFFGVSADPGQVLLMNWMISFKVDFCQEGKEIAKEEISHFLVLWDFTIDHHQDYGLKIFTQTSCFRQCDEHFSCWCFLIILRLFFLSKDDPKLSATSMYISGD